MSLKSDVRELELRAVRRVDPGVAALRALRQRVPSSGLCVPPSNACGWVGRLRRAVSSDAPQSRTPARVALRLAAVLASSLFLAACPTIAPPSSGARVSVVSPVSGAEYVSPLEVLIEASSPAGIDSVAAFLDGVAVCAWEGDAASYGCSVDAPVGSQVLEAAAEDAGGVRVSQSVSFEVVPAVCEVNPIEQIASDAGVPYEWVSILGEDCEVDADELWFVSEFLPDLRSRTTDRIAQTYRKFADDDGTIAPDERLVLERYFYGRVNHAGVQINPGYFSLFDQHRDDPEHRLAVARAEWVPLFVLPFENRVIPSFVNNGYGEPYYPDGGVESVNALYLPNRGDRRSFLDLLGSALQPQPDVTTTDGSPNSQFVFFQDQALVLDAPHAMRVHDIRYLTNAGIDGSRIENATVTFRPVSRSPSLRFPDLETFVVHADIDRLLVSEGDIVLPEQVWGYSELRLGGGIQVKWGHLSDDGHVGPDEFPKHVDSWEPSFSDASRRGLVLETALYREVDADGNPTVWYLGGSQDVAIKGGRLMSLDGTFDPLIWTRP